MHLGPGGRLLLYGTMGRMGRMGPMVMGQGDYGTILCGTMELWDSTHLSVKCRAGSEAGEVTQSQASRLRQCASGRKHIGG